MGISFNKVVSEFVKFGIIGTLGMVINIVIFYSLTEFFGIYYLLSAVISFFFAVTNNFVLNKIWTFKELFSEKFFIKYLKFVSTGLFALVINLALLFAFTELLKIYYLISQIIAIGLTLFINFSINKIWTFKDSVF